MAAIVRSVVVFDGVQAWIRLQRQLQQKNSWNFVPCATWVHVSKGSRRREPSGAGNLAVVGKVGTMLEELGGDAKIPDLWKMSALPEICPTDGKEQVLMRLDEIGEGHANFQLKAISFSIKMAEPSRTGQGDTSGPMDVDSVSGSERDDEDWEDADESQRHVRWYSCGLMGHVAKDRREKGEGTDKGKFGGNGYVKGTGKASSGKKDGGKFGGSKRA